MLLMRITEARVERLNMNTKESAGETGVLSILEPNVGAYYCADDSENKVEVPFEEVPDNWKLNEVKELEIDGEKGLYKLISLRNEDLIL